MERSETSEKIMQRIKLLTSLASTMTGNRKIEFCEKEFAFSAALLSVAILVSSYKPGEFSRRNFFAVLLAEVDFFISVIEAS